MIYAMFGAVGLWLFICAWFGKKHAVRQRRPSMLAMTWPDERVVRQIEESHCAILRVFAAPPALLEPTYATYPRVRIR